MVPWLTGILRLRTRVPVCLLLFAWCFQQFFIFRPISTTKTYSQACISWDLQLGCKVNKRFIYFDPTAGVDGFFFFYSKTNSSGCWMKSPKVDEISKSG